MRRFLLALGLALGLACGSQSPVGPGPVPTPTPAPSVSPAPSRPFPSRIEGGRFDPPLVGAVACCDDAGTPLIDEGYADGWELASPSVMDRWAAAGIGITHFRTGPYAGQDYSGLRRAVDDAAARRIMVEVTLIDGWVLRHGLSAWGEGCEVTQRAPRPHHIAHIERVVHETRAPHVIYEVGNEISLCHPSESWYRGVRDAAIAAGAHTVGGDADYGFLDYEVVHGFRVPPKGGKPILHNESDNSPHSVQQWLDLIRAELDAGITPFYWRGPDSREQEAAILAGIKGILNGTACAPPTSCPFVSRQGFSIHHCEGDVCLLDSTTKFDFVQAPCNAEHGEICRSSCGAQRLCEDPRGPAWGGVFRVMPGNPYQAKAMIGDTVEACARTDDEGLGLDAHGAPVEVSPMSCVRKVVSP